MFIKILPYYRLIKLSSSFLRFTISLVFALSSCCQQLLGETCGLLSETDSWLVTLMSLGKPITVGNMPYFAEVDI